ncbi:hypothetical protein Q8G35_22935 [Peribacillus simplex]|uniref:Uncharacterized protein n=2 Tax=Peribacillus TaxID=2675229 RepID=A0AA90PGB1_9BACI|nr:MULTISPECIES: hypothetical protein [Peribacillus]MDP1421154.1 hypothetical protein [Peribacillus simplex]MDP1453921.1 hypothetical protein [Peribacillus frigoritolerans]
MMLQIIKSGNDIQQLYSQKLIKDGIYSQFSNQLITNKTITLGGERTPLFDYKAELRRKKENKDIGTMADDIKALLGVSL